MDLLSALAIYAAVYARGTRQMAESDWAWQWMQTMPGPGWKFASPGELERHAARSAEWASWGYGPAQAAPHIEAGLSPIDAARRDAREAGLRPPPRPAEIRTIDPAELEVLRQARDRAIGE